MQLTMTGEYAVRAMLHLAALPPGTVVQIPEIAREWDIPENFLRKIAAMLSRGGLLASQRGAGGGISLGRPSQDISLLQVIEEVEGPIYLNKCIEAPGACERNEWCSVHTVWHEAQTKMREVLGSRSLAELALINAARRSG